MHDVSSYPRKMAQYIFTGMYVRGSSGTKRPMRRGPRRASRTLWTILQSFLKIGFSLPEQKKLNQEATISKIAVNKVKEKGTESPALFEEMKSLTERVRRRAYELFQRRDKMDGPPFDDWRRSRILLSRRASVFIRSSMWKGVSTLRYSFRVNLVQAERE